MRRIVSFLVIFSVGVLLLSGCATPLPMGQLYTQITLPSAVGSGSIAYTKVGTAKSTSILGLIATGDASIKKASENGGITQVKFVDYKAENFLGIVGTYTTTVYGD